MTSTATVTVKCGVGLPAVGEPGGDRAAHPGHRPRLLLALDRGDRRDRGAGPGPGSARAPQPAGAGRRGRGAGVGGGLDVALDDPALGARAGDRARVDAELGREPARARADPQPAAGALGARRTRRPAVERRPRAAATGTAGASGTGAAGAVGRRRTAPRRPPRRQPPPGPSAAHRGSPRRPRPIQPHTAFTGAVSPSATTCASRTPSSKVSTSIELLSVSISNRTSPWWTASPTALRQRVSVHSSVIWPGLGIRIGWAIVGLLRSLVPRLDQRRHGGDDVAGVGQERLLEALRLGLIPGAAPIRPTGASRSSNASAWIRATISLTNEPVSTACAATTQRPVLRTDARIVSMSSGTRLRRSMTSALTPRDDGEHVGRGEGVGHRRAPGHDRRVRARRARPWPRRSGVV